MVRLLVHTGRSFGRSDASRITTSVRGDVIDFASRNADIHQLAVAQVGQIGLPPRAFAPLMKFSPKYLERAEDLPPCGYMSQLSGPMYRAHLHVSWLDCFTTQWCQDTRWFA